jgi:hypothetical protein
MSSRAMLMNAGEKTIDWLFREQPRVDLEWSIKLPTGFTWWADRHAQTIVVVPLSSKPSSSVRIEGA